MDELHKDRCTVMFLKDCFPKPASHYLNRGGANSIRVKINANIMFGCPILTRILRDIEFKEFKGALEGSETV